MSKRVIKSVLATAAVVVCLCLVGAAILLLPEVITVWITPVACLAFLAFLSYAFFYHTVFDRDRR